MPRPVTLQPQAPVSQRGTDSIARPGLSFTSRPTRYPVAFCGRAAFASPRLLAELCPAPPGPLPTADRRLFDAPSEPFSSCWASAAMFVLAVCFLSLGLLPPGMDDGHGLLFSGPGRLPAAALGLMACRRRGGKIKITAPADDEPDSGHRRHRYAFTNDGAHPPKKKTLPPPQPCAGSGSRAGHRK